RRAPARPQSQLPFSSLNPLLDCYAQSFPSCDAGRGYLLSWYTRFAGESEGWKTPRMGIGSGPTFSMQCTFSGGRWEQDRGLSGTDWPPTWATPSPFTM